MINDIYNSTISTYQHIPHSNYDIGIWSMDMWAIFLLLLATIHVARIIFLTIYIAKEMLKDINTGA